MSSIPPAPTAGLARASRLERIACEKFENAGNTPRAVLLRPSP